MSMSLRLFYCYAREDKLLRDTLGRHLGNLKRQELIMDWHDRDINAGQEWAKEVDTNLNAADIILLLISTDFVQSEYCYSIEMKRALERHENGTAKVIPIFLRPGDYEGAPFSKLQGLPTDAIAITDRKWHNRDEAFYNVVQGLRKIVGQLHSNEWLSKGNEYFLHERYKEALNAFDQAIFFNPSNALAFLGKGQALNKLSSVNLNYSYSDAIDAFDHSIELDSSNPDAYVGKGEALCKVDWNGKNSEMILDAYAAAINIDPKHEGAYIAQGIALLAYGINEEALTSFELAISVAAIPNREVFKRKGDALSRLARYTEALEAYDICIRFGLKNGEVYKSAGKAFFEIEKYSEALDMYEKAISFNNGDLSQIYLEKGHALYQLTEYQEALKAYEKAITLLPMYAKTSLAQAYRSKGNIWQLLSQEAFKKAEELSPLPLEDVLGDLEDHPF